MTAQAHSEACTVLPTLCQGLCPSFLVRLFPGRFNHGGRDFQNLHQHNGNEFLRPPHRDPTQDLLGTPYSLRIHRLRSGLWPSIATPASV
jgi:hypothetical protein